MSQLKTIRLGGELGRKFGKVHRLAVASPAEAVRALCANYPAFREYVQTSDERGVGYKVLVGRGAATLERIHDPAGRNDITFMPVLRGAGKGGIFEIIAGIALITASFFIPGGAILSSFVFSVGVSLVLGGISSLLAPNPKTGKSTQASYEFSGPANTLAAGMPVPICYGNLIIGGAIISGGISVDQVATTQTGVPGLSATVQETTSGGVSSYQLFASWQPAGNAIGYDCIVQGNGLGPVQLARTNGTSFYYTVPGPGPYEVTVNPVESNSTTTQPGPGTVYGPTASVWSVFLAG